MKINPADSGSAPQAPGRSSTPEPDGQGLVREAATQFGAALAIPTALHVGLKATLRAALRAKYGSKLDDLFMATGVKPGVKLAESPVLPVLAVPAGPPGDPMRPIDRPPPSMHLDPSGRRAALRDGNNNAFAVNLVTPEQLRTLPAGRLLYDLEGRPQVSGYDPETLLGNSERPGSRFTSVGFRVPPTEEEKAQARSLCENNSPGDSYEQSLGEADQAHEAFSPDGGAARGPYGTDDGGSDSSRLSLAAPVDGIDSVSHDPAGMGMDSARAATPHRVVLGLSALATDD